MSLKLACDISSLLLSVRPPARRGPGSLSVLPAADSDTASLSARDGQAVQFTYSRAEYVTVPGSESLGSAATAVTSSSVGSAVSSVDGPRPPAAPPAGGRGRRLTVSEGRPGEGLRLRAAAPASLRVHGRRLGLATET